MKRAWFYIVFVFFLTIYIYSIVFKLVPISTKILFEIFGVFYCLKYFNDNSYRLKREYITIIRIILLIVIWDIITSALNGSFEFHLIKVMAPLIGSIFLAHYLYDYSRNNIKNADDFLFLVVLTIFLESVLSVLLKLSPPVYGVFDSLLVFELGNEGVATDIYDLARFYGIGNAIYFGVLPSCALGVVTAVYIIKTTDIWIRRISVAFMYVLIAVVSFFIARTAIVLVGISVLLLLFYALQNGIRNMLRMSLLLAIFVVLTYYVVSVYIGENDELGKWAFGFIEDKDVDTGTAGRLKEWYETTSFDIKTLLFGDAHYVGPNGGYYKQVDVGYFREIFYGGIIGLGLNLYLHLKVLKMIFKYRKDSTTKYMLMTLFVCYLAMLLKGDTNMVSFFVLYLVFMSGGAFERIGKCKPTSSL